jgi:GNAT superfamily N-acetyltransferase
MPFIIRPLRSDEYEGAADLVRRLGHRRRDAAEAWRADDDASAGAPLSFQRWAAMDDASGEMAGYAAAWHMREAKYRMDAMVEPRFRRRGIGGALLDTVLGALAGAGAATVQARTSDDDLPSLAFLQARGFVEIHRVREMWRDPRAPDLPSVADLPARLEAEGVRFVAFAEGAERPGFWAEMTALQNDVLRDWPDPDPDPDPPPVTEDEVRRFFEWIIPDASILAIVDGRIAGYTGLGGGEPGAGLIESGPTAVLADYRGLGLATALKVLAVREARRRGFTRALARSASPPMIRVSEKVGFVPARAEVRLLRRLGVTRVDA